MTAFLFISPSSDARMGRRVDFANIGSLFADVEQPPRRHEKNQAARIGLMILILLGVIGDTLLVTRPEALAAGFVAHPARAAYHTMSS